MGEGEVLFIPGNHDHRLAEPLLEGLALAGEATLGLEHRQRPAMEASVQIDGWLVRVDSASPIPAPGFEMTSMPPTATTWIAICRCRDSNASPRRR